jgi:hypothetical protein
MLFRGIIALYSENHMEHMITFCGQNAEILNVKGGGSYNYSCAFSG